MNYEYFVNMDLDFACITYEDYRLYDYIYNIYIHISLIQHPNIFYHLDDIFPRALFHFNCINYTIYN